MLQLNLPSANHISALASPLGFAPATQKQIAESRVQVKQRLTHYDICGHTGQELLEQMNQLGPEGWHGLTRWQIKARPVSQANQRTGYTVCLEVELILPRWGGSRWASEKLKGGWRQFYAKLLAHEQGHVERLTVTAHNYLHGLLRQASELELKAILEAGEYINAIYDQVTEHGYTQGVETRLLVGD